MRGFGVKELLGCYARGVFPMAESRGDPRIFLLDPDERGWLDDYHAGVLARIGPQVDAATRRWLEAACAPL